MSKDVFKDLGFNEDESRDLHARSDMLIVIQKEFRDALRRGTQLELAKKVKIDQPKVSKLMNGKIGEFSVERLREYLHRLGYDVTFTAAGPVRVEKPSRKTKGSVVSS